jgi:hypothetical protein
MDVQPGLRDQPDLSANATARHAMPPLATARLPRFADDDANNVSSKDVVCGRLHRWCIVPGTTRAGVDGVWGTWRANSLNHVICAAFYT